MAHEQLHEAIRPAGIDAEGLHLRRHRRSLAALQCLQRVDHTTRSGEVSTAAIGAKLAAPRKPTDDQARDDAEHDLRHQSGQEKADPGFFPSFLNSALSTMLPMIRARKITNVFSTPCSRARVTISPFATWVIS